MDSTGFCRLCACTMSAHCMGTRIRQGSMQQKHFRCGHRRGLRCQLGGLLSRMAGCCLLRSIATSVRCTVIGCGSGPFSGCGSGCFAGCGSGSVSGSASGSVFICTAGSASESESVSGSDTISALITSGSTSCCGSGSHSGSDSDSESDSVSDSDIGSCLIITGSCCGVGASFHHVVLVGNRHVSPSF